MGEKKEGKLTLSHFSASLRGATCSSVRAKNFTSAIFCGQCSVASSCGTSGGPMNVLDKEEVRLGRKSAPPPDRKRAPAHVPCARQHVIPYSAPTPALAG